MSMKVQSLMGSLAARRSEFTPDWYKLKKGVNEMLPVFVYGTLKTGGAFHSTLAGCPTLGEGLTAAKYNMMMAQDFPVIFREKDSKDRPKHRVKGEVYLVDLLTLRDIDILEGNTFLYHRYETFVTLIDPEQSYKTTTGSSRPHIKTWAYFGDLGNMGGTDNLQEVDCLKAATNSECEHWDWNQYEPTRNAKLGPPWSEDDIPDFLKKW